MSFFQYLLRPLFATLVLSITTGPALAAEFCATTALELSDALDTADTNGQDDEIRVATGFYDSSGIDAFTYDALSPVSGDDYDLTLVGGYTELSGNPCGQVLVEDPLLTVLDAGGDHRVMTVYLLQNSSITIRLLTFVSGNATQVALRGGGLNIEAAGGSTGRITVERNAFIENTAKFSGGLSATSYSGGFGQLRVINNLFLNNHATETVGAAGLGNGTDQAGLNGIYFANNTVINNTVGSLTNPTGGVYIFGPVGKFVYNNNLWNNTGSDLRVYGGGAYVVHNNNIGVRLGMQPSSEQDNLSVTPEYQYGNYSYTPTRASALVDAGFHPAPASTAWYLTALDLGSQARLVGGVVDIGAYENERIFANDFEFMQIPIPANAGSPSPL